MNAELKKALLRDTQAAFYALRFFDGDGPYDPGLSKRLPADFHDAWMTVASTLSVLMAQLESEIGTDNL